MKWEVLLGDKVEPKIFLLSLNRTTRASELSKILAVDYTTAYKAVNKLLDEGFLKKVKTEPYKGHETVYITANFDVFRKFFEATGLNDEEVKFLCEAIQKSFAAYHFYPFIVSTYSLPREMIQLLSPQVKFLKDLRDKVKRLKTIDACDWLIRPLRLMILLTKHLQSKKDLNEIFSDMTKKLMQIGVIRKKGKRKIKEVMKEGRQFAKDMNKIVETVASQIKEDNVKRIEFFREVLEKVEETAKSKWFKQHHDEILKLTNKAILGWYDQFWFELS
ncbi:MAG: helix-turn-helix domain-containing protein [Candidatus Baldrarchaeia archaeon]